jgi:uncharacterized protein YkwD
MDRVHRYSRRKWTGIGENIAAGYANSDATCSGWMQSPGHRANILRPSYRYIGGGYAHGSRGYGRYYVQDFGTR